MSAPTSRRLNGVGWGRCAFVISVLLHGCTGTMPEEVPAPVVERAPDYRHGARVYRLYCGTCHDSGQSDAPTLDDIEAWDERAFQWESVLKQHAAQGFLEMPPQGDHLELSEQSMNDVMFFMLTKMRALDE